MDKLSKDGEFDWKFLVNVKDEQESDIIQSLLITEKIPIMKKRRGMGLYMNTHQGMTRNGVDVFVYENHYEKASEILVSLGQSDGIHRSPVSKKTRIIIWVFIGLLALPVLIGLIAAIVKLVSL